MLLFAIGGKLTGNKMKDTVVKQLSSLHWLWLAVVVLGIDRLTKVIAEAELTFAQATLLSPGSLI